MIPIKALTGTLIRTTETTGPIRILTKTIIPTTERVVITGTTGTALQVMVGKITGINPPMITCPTIAIAIRTRALTTTINTITTATMGTETIHVLTVATIITTNHRAPADTFGFPMKTSRARWRRQPINLLEQAIRCSQQQYEFHLLQ